MLDLKSKRLYPPAKLTGRAMVVVGSYYSSSEIIWNLKLLLLPCEPQLLSEL